MKGGERKQYERGDRKQNERGRVKEETYVAACTVLPLPLVLNKGRNDALWNILII